MHLCPQQVLDASLCLQQVFYASLCPQQVLDANLWAAGVTVDASLGPLQVFV